MPFTTTTAAAASLLFSSVNIAAVLAPGSSYDQSSAPVHSGNFIVHSKPTGASGFDASLGYLHAKGSYAPGWDATLDTSKSNAIPGYISDANNPSNASLEFSGGGHYDMGLLLAARSDKWPNSRAKMRSGEHGTPGISVVDGLLQWQTSDGVEISWFGKSQRIMLAIRKSAADLLEACPDTLLEWGPATTLEYKWANTTTIQGCFDVDLVIEYV
jgi:hypothetical protein